MLKELFYDTDTIDSQSKILLDEIMHLRAKHSLKFKPTKSAMLVIDVQQYFCDTASHAFIPSAKAIIPRIKKLQDLFLKQNIDVIHTKHANTDANAGMMAKWWPKILEENSPYAPIVPELIDSRIITFSKNQYDAFFGTELDEYLRSHNIEQLIITGVMTHLCCETTARSAFVRGYETFIIIDAMATYNLGFHRASILNAAHGFAMPVLTKEIINNELC